MFQSVDHALAFAYQHQQQTGKLGVMLENAANGIPSGGKASDLKDVALSIRMAVATLPLVEQAYCQAKFGYSLDTYGMKILADFVNRKMGDLGFLVGTVLASDLLVYELLNPCRQIELKGDILPRHALTISQLQTRRQHINLILTALHCDVINSLELLFENKNIIDNSTICA